MHRWHIDALVQMDATRLSYLNGVPDKDEKEEDVVSSRELTPDLFNAIFSIGSS